MKRLLALVALLGVAASAQTVSVTSTQLTDSAGNLYSGLIFLQPTLSNGTPTAYRKGGGGTVTSAPVRVTVTAGAFTLNLPDTTLTYPANICFKLSATNIAAGYACLQPHATPTGSGDWCQSGGCNLDNYLPALNAQLPTTVTTTINGTTGALLFVGAGLVQVGDTFTFSGGGGAPPTSPGIANSSGSAWLTSYSATNPIPFNFLTGVQAALGFTPYNATNPSGYITASSLSPYALTSSLGTGAFATIANYLTVANAASTYQSLLGFTPYNSTNPAGYITPSALTPYALTSALANYPLTSSLGTGAYATIANYLTTATASSTYQPLLGFTPYNATNPAGYITNAIATLPSLSLPYSQLSGAPTIPTVGTWGALNYPSWVSGTPFVKMTASGTFALDLNTYLTSITSLEVTTALGYTPVAPTVTTLSSLTNVAGGTFGTAAFTASTAYDPSGAAAAALTSAETFAANASNLTSGTVAAARVATLNQNTTGTAANLSGTPALPNGTTATTQTVGDNTTKIATDAFVLANGSSYTLPTATSTVLGGVKPDGTTISNTSGAIAVAVPVNSTNILAAIAGQPIAPSQVTTSGTCSVSGSGTGLGCIGLAQAALPSAGVASIDYLYAGTSGLAESIGTGAPALLLYNGGPAGTPFSLTLTNGTGLPGAGLVNNSITATQLAAQYSKGSCTEAWGGSGASHALSAGDDAVVNNTCYNDSGVTRTITAVKCRNNNATNTTTVNPTFGAAGTGTTILSAALTCGSAYAYSASGTVSGAAWTTGNGIDPVQGGTLTGTSVALIVEYTF